MVYGTIVRDYKFSVIL